MARSPPPPSASAARPCSPRPQTPGRTGSGTRSPSQPARGPRDAGGITSSGHGETGTRWGAAASPPKQPQLPPRQRGKEMEIECKHLPPHPPPAPQVKAFVKHRLENPSVFSFHAYNLSPVVFKDLDPTATRKPFFQSRDCTRCPPPRWLH